MLEFDEHTGDGYVLGFMRGADGVICNKKGFGRDSILCHMVIDLSVLLWMGRNLYRDINSELNLA